MAELGVVEHNARGFEFIQFTDTYACPCSLQQSSLADRETPGTSAVWLGSNKGARMHLRRAQVAALAEALRCWLDTGSFQPAEQQGEAGG